MRAKEFIVEDHTFANTGNAWENGKKDAMNFRPKNVEKYHLRHKYRSHYSDGYNVGLKRQDRSINPETGKPYIKFGPNGPITPGQGVAEGYSNTTFNVDRRKLNVPALIQQGAILVTHPHSEQGWELDNKEDWAYSLLSLYNVTQGGWPSEAKKYLKPASYKKAEQQINSSAPNLGSDKLVYDGKYNQILWSIKKLGIPDNVAFLDKDKQGVAESFDQPYPMSWEKGDFGDVDALAKLDDGTNLHVMFNLADRSENDWGVEFYRGNSQSVTGQGDAQRVFATVLAAIGRFIKKQKPDRLFFTAVKEEDPTGSRAKLYDRLVQKYATGLGYELHKVDYPQQTGYKLTRKEQKISQAKR